MCCGRIVVLAQPGADPGRVDVTQVIQDAQGLLPGVLGAVLVAGGVADVAKVGEELGFIEAVAEFAHDVDGAKMAVDGFGEVAELMLGVAEAVAIRCSSSSSVFSSSTGAGETAPPDGWWSWPRA